MEKALVFSRGAKIERAHAKWRGPTLNWMKVLLYGGATKI